MNLANEKNQSNMAASTQQAAGSNAQTTYSNPRPSQLSNQHAAVLNNLANRINLLSAMQQAQNQLMLMAQTLQPSQPQTAFAGPSMATGASNYNQGHQQAQNQLMLMSQLLQLSQPETLVGALNNNSQVLAQFANLQQQLNAMAQMNTLQSAVSSNATMNSLGVQTAQQQAYQQLLGLGNLNLNLGGSLPNALQLLSSTVPSVAASAASFPTTSIHTQAKSEADPAWDDQFNALQRFRLVNGHTKVPARYKENAKLGRWVMTQRRQMALMTAGCPNALTPERIAMLDSIGFNWSVRSEPKGKWDDMVDELKEFKATFGNTLVPQRYRANPQLGTWVHTQRRQYKLQQEGKKSSMTQQKIDVLDAIGFVWVARKNEQSSDGEDSDAGAAESKQIKSNTKTGEVDTKKKSNSEVAKEV